MFRAKHFSAVLALCAAALLITGCSTKPPTRGAERGRSKKLMNTAAPSRPNTIEGTAARLLMLTSISSVQRLRGANSSR